MAASTKFRLGTYRVKAVQVPSADKGRDLWAYHADGILPLGIQLHVDDANDRIKRAEVEIVSFARQHGRALNPPEYTQAQVDLWQALTDVEGHEPLSEEEVLGLVKSDDIEGLRAFLGYAKTTDAAPNAQAPSLEEALGESEKPGTPSPSTTEPTAYLPESN